jgi:hypothetical protein
MSSYKKYSGTKYGKNLDFDELYSGNLLVNQNNNLSVQQGGSINKFDFIVHPLTNKKISIFSKNGILVLEKYKTFIN